MDWEGCAACHSRRRGECAILCNRNKKRLTKSAETTRPLPCRRRRGSKEGPRNRTPSPMSLPRRRYVPTTTKKWEGQDGPALFVGDGRTLLRHVVERRPPDVDTSPRHRTKLIVVVLQAIGMGARSMRLYDDDDGKGSVGTSLAGRSYVPTLPNQAQARRSASRAAASTSVDMSSHQHHRPHVTNGHLRLARGTTIRPYIVGEGRERVRK